MKITKITFTYENLKHIHYSHDDTLVISQTIINCLVKGILVDNRSSIDIIFLLTSKHIGVEESKMERAETHLVSFNRKVVIAIGKFVLPISTNNVIILSAMMVFNFPSTYNTIVGRPSLHTMKIVPFTLHHKIKFPTLARIQEL